jgi:hypothetical protein
VRGKFWLGLAVSAALLWVAVRGVSPEEVRQSLAEVRPVRFWLTAVRWQVLLRPV